MLELANPDRTLAKGIHKGYVWEVCHNQNGFRCGYVRVPENHPWAGKDWDELQHVSCHCGLTYAGPDDSSKAWWIGFDCAHACDAPDPTLPGYSDIMARAFSGPEMIRTLEYVRADCLNICEQAEWAMAQGTEMRNELRIAADLLRDYGFDNAAGVLDRADVLDREDS